MRTPGRHTRFQNISQPRFKIFILTPGRHTGRITHTLSTFQTHTLAHTASVLLSLSFAFEIVVVFVATVTGTMLLSGGQRLVHPFDPFAISATHLLHRELEFEYILIRAGFFQGLLNWLIASASASWSR